MQAPAFVLGYHGCDEDVGEAVLDGHTAIELSTNEHDWLGTGAYFWENDFKHGIQWAEFIARRSQNDKQKIRKPFVLGAIIDLGECLDLHIADCRDEILRAYNALDALWRSDPAIVRPENQKSHSGDMDFTRRFLDCHVINAVHRLGEKKYDTVRGGFLEGKPLYEGAAIKEGTHIQICVRDPAKSIVGYFRVKEFPRKTALLDELRQGIGTIPG